MLNISTTGIIRSDSTSPSDGQCLSYYGACLTEVSITPRCLSYRGVYLTVASVSLRSLSNELSVLLRCLSY